MGEKLSRGMVRMDALKNVLAKEIPGYDISVQGLGESGVMYYVSVCKDNKIVFDGYITGVVDEALEEVVVEKSKIKITKTCCVDVKDFIDRCKKYATGENV